MTFRRVAIAGAAAVLVFLLAEAAYGPTRPDPVGERPAAEPIRVAFFGRLLGKGGDGTRGCVSPDSVRDRDVRRNVGLIRQADLCVTAEALTENGIDWRFVSIAHKKARNGPVWYLPHDNESEAFDAAVYAVARYGGRLVAVDGGESRNYRGVDPNRTFALTAAEAVPCAIRHPAPQYTRYVMSLFEGARHVMSMHNNTSGGTITVDVSDGKSTGYRTKGAFSDPDHMVFLAGRGPMDGSARSMRDRLLSAGLNVVYEEVSVQNNDCSFSNHIALKDRREYFNIEAVHGSRQQKDMVDALMRVLGYRAVG